MGILVGVGRFELPASCSQNKCSNLAELHPEFLVYLDRPCGSLLLIKFLRLC